MIYNIESLAIMMSTVCNQNCKHCLRGKTTNEWMKRNIINEFFNKIPNSCISSLTFTGGEPSLNPEVIEWVLDACMMYDIDIGNIYLVTNGLKFNQELKDAFRYFYNYCFDKELSGFAISEDSFHEKIPYINKQKYYLPNPTYYDLMELDIASEEAYYDILDEEYYLEYARPNDKKTDYTKSSIINEGNAKLNHIGDRNLSVYIPIIDKYDDEIFIRDEVLMLTPRGEIHTGCDWSYKTYNLNSKNTLLGNVFENFDIIIKNIEKRKENVYAKNN